MDESLGLGLHAGETHYRAYVGPPEDYDLIAATTFNLLTTAGLRQHHKLIDIGCGSLRVGRLLIPYLNRGNYIGVEPNRWLVEEAIAKEIGTDMVRIKRPNFIFASSLKSIDNSFNADFAVAQSIFSHASLNLIDDWLAGVAFHLASHGALFATYLKGEEDHQGRKWVYPGCVSYRTETLSNAARAAVFSFAELDWPHPRQTWAMFARPGFEIAKVHGIRTIASSGE